MDHGPDLMSVMNMSARGCLKFSSTPSSWKRSGNRAMEALIRMAEPSREMKLPSRPSVCRGREGGDGLRPR